ncbi:hypothetical protein Amn_31020 [Aminobacter sp. Y103A]|uniref:hypothetical protein n=1 Tax=Aminobacter sp. Y103A TaxID=1870862 RepID=UPI00257434E7|nr:hypothetical protein [Aminobacter sp. SS-2016]BBD38222.1 hypothetical protein Amn_31020 [Aminobacter sp. SS-2016]
MHIDQDPTVAPISTTSLSDLKASIGALIAADAAFFEAASAHGLDIEVRNAVTALRHAEDFLQQAAMALATGSGLASPDVLTPFRWAVMKVVEFNAVLPEELRGDLSVHCFRRDMRQRRGRAVAVSSSEEEEDER